MAPNFTKLKNISFFWDAEEKNLGQANFQKIRELFTKKLSLSSQKHGFGIRDPVSGKNPFRIPDPGVKRHRILDPGSGAQYCWECYTFSRGDVGIWCLNIIWSIFENFKIWNRNEHFGLNFRELRNNFLGLLKILKFVDADADPILGIFLTLDPRWKNFRSGIRDKHPGYATLIQSLEVFNATWSIATPIWRVLTLVALLWKWGDEIFIAS